MPLCLAMQIGCVSSLNRQLFRQTVWKYIHKLSLFTIQDLTLYFVKVKLVTVLIQNWVKSDIYLIGRTWNSSFIYVGNSEHLNRCTTSHWQLRLLLLLNSGVFFHSKYFITNKSPAMCEHSVTGNQLTSQMRLGLLQRLNSIQCVNVVDEVLNKLFALAQHGPGLWQHI